MVTRMLTFEISLAHSEITVHGDVASIRSLAKRLERAAAEAESQTESHVHLFSDLWEDGGDLTKTHVGPKTLHAKAADHVKIYCWDTSKVDVVPGT
jgi:hypothetical protein